MKKIIVFFVFIVFVFGVYYVKQANDQEIGEFYYHDDFESLNEEFWYVGNWKSMLSAYDKVKLSNGIIKLEIDEVDQGPVLLSKPIKVGQDQIISVKRRVRLNHTDELFTGGFALIETNDVGLIPSSLNNDEQILGNGIVLVEYVNGQEEGSIRPGSNTFRLLPRTWMVEASNDWLPPIFVQWFTGNYKLIPSKYNTWIEEEIIYDTFDGTVTYIIDDVTYQVWSEVIVQDSIRLYMHGYGFGTGHTVEIDWIEISVK